MIRSVALIALFLCACASPPEAPVADTTLITFQVSSWGYVQERWSIAADGHATLEQTQPGARFGSPLLPAQTFALTPADFERIRETLAPTERFIAHGLHCDVEVTDAPYGTVTWRRADGAEERVSFYSACRETRDLTLFFSHLNDAELAFRELTNTRSP